jgi:hypothetical protein
MARAKNPHGLRGKADNHLYYELNGIEVTRTVGVVPKSKYKNSPGFRRMRENMSEFGGQLPDREGCEAFLVFKAPVYGESLRFRKAEQRHSQHHQERSAIFTMYSTQFIHLIFGQNCSQGFGELYKITEFSQLARVNSFQL